MKSSLLTLLVALLAVMTLTSAVPTTQPVTHTSPKTTAYTNTQYQYSIDCDATQVTGVKNPAGTSLTYNASGTPGAGEYSASAVVDPANASRYFVTITLGTSIGRDKTIEVTNSDPAPGNATVGDTKWL